MDTIDKKGVCCAHCGEECPGEPVRFADKIFCCQGCRMVYQLLDDSGLCNYYRLNEHPGINRKITVREDKFAILDDEKVKQGLISFSDGAETHVTFYLPAIHCSSCLYLLEHLYKLEEGVKSSTVDFAAKTVSVVFDHSRLELRQLAELLTSLGYEPYISLRDWGGKVPPRSRGLIYPLGVAGFCFGNIMLLSFPEYLGLDHSEAAIQHAFRYLSLLLSLPVVFYCAQPFYRSAFKGLKHRFLNIDAPIVLAIAVTFCRSVLEIVSGHGSGYFDSLSGIIFFMLLGRVLQDRTYRQLSFERDYTAYFPVAVTVVVTDKQTGLEKESVKTMQDIKSGDTLRIHSGELIPADGILTRGRASIDYSFVTGESTPVGKSIGELIYAGGKQEGAVIELLVVREVTQSYLTQLWNRQDRSGSGRDQKEEDFSFVHPLSRYFTYVVLAIALGAALYWSRYDASRALNALTAVLIIACPCALLLSATFTNGNLLRILGKNHFYLRNADVIERIAETDHIVFDKTGTLTQVGRQSLNWVGEPLSDDERRLLATLADQSNHPLSRSLSRELPSAGACAVLGFEEHVGEGITGFVDGRKIALGSQAFIMKKMPASGDAVKGSRMFAAIDGRPRGYFEVTNPYREGISVLIGHLRKRFPLTVLSGDNEREKERLTSLFGWTSAILFNQTPASKAAYISYLQRNGHNVLMVGDGLNDAGALQESHAGIALTEGCNNFTPASDAILKADRLGQLPAFIRLCRAGKRIIMGSFILSIIYNLAGLAFAVTQSLSPLVAAILMPASSLTILLVTYGFSSAAAKRLGL